LKKEVIKMREVQKHIIDTLGAQPTIDPKTEIRRRVDFIKTMIAGSRRKGVVLGISGGQDSTLAGKLSQLAVDELNAEGYEAKFVAVRLPYGEQRDGKDADDAIAYIKPTEARVVNIKDPVDALVGAHYGPVKDYHKGNVKARMRMIVQYLIAGEEELLVVGTDNLAELISGYFTIGGDGQADLLPLAQLNKRQEKSLLKVLTAPEHLYLKVPTADLLDGVQGQPDETELGVTYDEIDDYLEGIEINPLSAKKIEDRYFATEFKRHLAFGPSDID
jgi:NAD+ synthase